MAAALLSEGKHWESRGRERRVSAWLAVHPCPLGMVGIAIYLLPVRRQLFHLGRWTAVARPCLEILWERTEKPLQLYSQCPPALVHMVLSNLWCNPNAEFQAKGNLVLVPKQCQMQILRLLQSLDMSRFKVQGPPTSEELHIPGDSASSMKYNLYQKFFLFLFLKKKNKMSTSILIIGI